MKEFFLTMLPSIQATGDYLPVQPEIRRIGSMDKAHIAKVEKVLAKVKALPEDKQVHIPVHRTLHAGIYSRTVITPAGSLIVGGLVQKPTTLIVNGWASVYAGDEVLELAGNQVIVASANRQQVVYSHADTTCTLCYATQAKTIEEAEQELGITEEMTVASQDKGLNTMLITGE